MVSESIAFDPLGRGPYTGVADGRILFWNGHSWTHFAYTSPNRSEVCNPKECATLHSYVNSEHICGRPLGLRSDKRTGDLYIADAYFGLMKVGPEGGPAISLATEAEGVPLRFTNDVDIDAHGNKFPSAHVVISGEHSGRIFKYDPATKETSVLVRNIKFPNGISLSKDGSFFVYTESSIGRRNMYSYMNSLYPRMRKVLLKLPIPSNIRFMMIIGGKLRAVAVKYNHQGKLVQILEDSEGKVVKELSEVEEKDGKLWMGSVMVAYIAVYNLTRS
ncbi:protein STRICTOSIDINE SYNTHASE-LIKE 3-like [Arachis hypogaea]|uniref:protein STRICTOSIDINE SYNTHASE-LIKE 3-like n=1 Tax=Arachis hypogaea TaxID=3818 RepID=UPI003B21D2A5